MAKRVEVKTELTSQELHERSRQASELVERTHWHMLWLMKEGHTPQEVASRVGYTAAWVRKIVRRYNDQGEQGITNHRLSLPGAKPLLDQELQNELDQALQQAPQDEGLWSGPKVAAWMEQKLGRPVDKRRGWDDLQRLRDSTRVPRPQHEEASEAEQSAFKKTRGGADGDPTSPSTSGHRAVEE
jgi:transposase